MGAGDSMDQALEPQAAEVIGHLRGRVRPPEERGDSGPEFAVAKAVREMGKSAQGLEEGHQARIAETQGGDALAVSPGGLLEAVEGFLSQDAVMAEAFHLEQFAVDAVPQVAQVREVVNPLTHVKVFGVVNRGLGAEGVSFFEVLLEVRGLVFDEGCTPSVITRVR